VVANGVPEGSDPEIFGACPNALQQLAQLISVNGIINTPVLIVRIVVDTVHHHRHQAATTD
jgi:hypothetical protein